MKLWTSNREGGVLSARLNSKAFRKKTAQVGAPPWAFSFPAAFHSRGTPIQGVVDTLEEK